ncbi:MULTISPECIES: hypothetical protein [Amycolatopsis]|uniref:Uncharacterized protein n=2 Tax=Amycolatopsis TaxID=1813 RepID=A0A2N3WF33_9PSEU|nr:MULTISPECIES: hypothetical protein [Amycolatopsis]MBB2506391.1 hypothetical protein [Amycolatopsis echigonensis]PKV92457.1 hypothetical protein ATK30_3261 [Amycolatopsis niigatensis]TVT16786.1 hypothetical protein FNH06_34120 [Amycolatopsis acidiphila]UIJ59644.1 hypothetical protein LWP59_37440 [Amycolatopsis acidiphila]GHG81074.1 hypothetical protein GCM10017788_50700 [Amycolatopsis acidiphila]
MTATHTTPTDPTVPPDAVTFVPASPGTVPLRNPAGAWALVVTSVRLGLPDHDYPTDPAHTDTAEMFAGVWLPAPPPAHVHRGDVVVRLTPPADNDPARVDVEVLAAAPGEWHTVATFAALDTRWPHHVATTVTTWMRALADRAEQELAVWVFASSIFGKNSPPRGPRPPGLADAAQVDPDAPDALADLIRAGELAIGDELVWNDHTATIGPHGELVHHTGPEELRISTVSALATSLATPTTVNGWHLWRRARDGRPLARLRADLATA